MCLGPTGNLQRTYNLFSLLSGKKIIRGQFTEVPTPKIVMKRVENRTGATVKDILLDDEANEAFKKIDRNIAVVEWEAEI